VLHEIDFLLKTFATAFNSAALLDMFIKFYTKMRKT